MALGLRLGSSITLLAPGNGPEDAVELRRTSDLQCGLEALRSMVAGGGPPWVTGGRATGDPSSARRAAGWRGQAGSSSSVTSSMRTRDGSPRSRRPAPRASRAGLRERGVGSWSIEGAVWLDPERTEECFSADSAASSATCPG